jgi:DNA-binding SARP family transcriptional activator
VETHPHLNEGPLRIRLLGSLRVERQGLAVPLPASKRTRALLGYLVASGGAQTRQALCDLLWDGPDDPRAELRWSLTKLRPVLDDAHALRIASDRERVAFVACGAAIDIADLHALLTPGLASASVDRLEQAAALFAGEFLDGLDLPACYRFHQWCMAERERHAARHRKVLTMLVERLADEPERALVPARAWAAVDPLSEAAHAALVRVLALLGRGRDADAHALQAEAMFRRELGVVPSGELRDAARLVRADLRSRPQSAAAAEAARPAAPASSNAAAAAAPVGDPGDGAGDDVDALAPTPLVGRNAECDALDASMRSLERPAMRPLLLFVGEPGIGKTRLLDALVERAQRASCLVLQARCYEAEMARPYGCWIDALRTVPVDQVPLALRGDLAPLLRLADNVAVEAGDRTHLFDAVATWLLEQSAARPVVLVLDDLQWVDEASCSLLHYVVRSAVRPSRLLVAGAARQGEVDDNPWARGLLHSLTRLQRLRSSALGPLGAAELAVLLARAAPRVDAGEVHRASGGNPLYALAFARAQAQGDVLDGPTWEALVEGEMQRLDEYGRELIAWAAAFGREFRVDLLGDALGWADTDLLARLERLERRGLLRPTGAGLYDFAHDLVRDAVMRGISAPRRRAVHRHLAEVIQPAAAQSPSLYGELVHHAIQGEDHALAARASIAAAEHCLRVFANAQAAAVAQRGLASLAHLQAGRERAAWHIALLRLQIVAVAYPAGACLPTLGSELQRAIETARLLGLDADAASGLHMLSWLTQNANDTEATTAATLHAEKMSRSSDPAARCQQLANTGRCLLEVEADVPQARRLLVVAAAQADELAIHPIELEWAQGLLARWDGDLEAAQASVARAVELARASEDRWREFECLVWLAAIRFERGHFAAVELLCAEIVATVARMGTLKAPATEGLRALARLAQATNADQRQAAQAALDEAIQGLRALDDKAHLAYVLNQAAQLALQRGRPDDARHAAAEALDAAETVKRNTEMHAARALLALAACAAGHPEEAADGLRDSRYAEAAATAPSARARQLLERADEALNSNVRSNAGAADSIPHPAS